jgi:16S rRNA (adenine1518-N6/adenine1519-N6)-dimethyltransferase
MADLTDKNELIEYLKANGLYAKHSLGQNFLVDREALDKIVEAAELDGDLVIEVGPGLGTMTEELVKVAGKVVAVEIDEKLAKLLEDQSGAVISTSQSEEKYISRQEGKAARNDKLEIFNSDILKINIPEIVGGRPYKVVANIPYYITSKILQLFLTLPHKPETIVVLTQKEVAERVCAKAGGMSVLSISVQAYGEPEIVAIVPKGSFFPSPKVDSAILRIKNIHSFDCHSEQSEESSERRERAAAPRSFVNTQDDIVCLEKPFFRLVKIGFASRRKTLVNNLSVGYHIDKKLAADIISKAGFGLNARAQELGVEDWLSLLRIMNYEL